MFAMFPPTRYVRGGVTRAHKRDDLYQLLTKLKFRLPACIVWFHYASSSIIGWFLDNFFLLSVLVSLKLHTNYTLSRKKKKILIIGTLGSGWDRKFYMGTQNGSNYEL